MANEFNLTDQELVRREKMEALREKGIDPFGKAYHRTTNSLELKTKYEHQTKEDLLEINDFVSVAGRIMTKRSKGKAGFMHIQDKFGQLQIYVRSDHLSESEFELFKKGDIGDIVGVEGQVIRTDTGEITIKAHKYTHLSKALRPLPEKFHGLQDKEEARRHRYVDLIMNDESRRLAFLRPRVVRAFQKFFDSKGFVEVETPILQPILGGAAARPFVTHHNALDMNFYLRIATELPLKRLIVGGMEAVYEIGRLFRNEGMDSTHNPEFTTIEAYLAYSDMQGIMDLIEELFHFLCEEIVGNKDIEYQGDIIHLGDPFKRIHMVDAIKEVTGINFYELNDLDELLNLAKEHNIEVGKHERTYGHIVNLFFEKYVEDTLVQPTFVYGHPLEISPLAKKASDPRFTERFELFIKGKEYGNAFSELNDPIDQKERFLNQLKEKDLGNDEACEMDTDYIEALEYGMPPTGGLGIGIDRVVMLLGQTDSIRDVLLFPQMKSLNSISNNKVLENKNNQKEEEKIDFSKVKIEPLFEEYIDFETFSKADFRAVKIEACEAVAKSKKLLKFTLNDGTDKKRTILSGIHEYYEPEELIGKTAIAIVNLPPRKMMGIDSEGMLISAVHKEDDKESLNLLIVNNRIPAGAKLY